MHAARSHVKGSSKTLQQTSQQLDALVRSLILVKDEPSLQTASVTRQVSAIVEIGEELRAYFDELRQRQEKNSTRQLLHALKSGDGDDKQLSGILDRLDNARSELILCIDVAQVGLIGNLSDGFRVASRTLAEVNEKVKELSEKSMAPIELTKNCPVENGQ